MVQSFHRVKLLTTVRMLIMDDVSSYGSVIITDVVLGVGSLDLFGCLGNVDQ